MGKDTIEACCKAGKYGENNKNTFKRFIDFKTKGLITFGGSLVTIKSKSALLQFLKILMNAPVPPQVLSQVLVPTISSGNEGA